MIIYLNAVTPVLIYRPIQNSFNYYLLTSSPPKDLANLVLIT